jgi:hypothetical protein
MSVDGAASSAVARTDPAPSPAASEPEVVTRLIRIAGSIVAPTTLLSALLIFFGTSHAYFFYRYFGVNSTVLGLGTQDYLMRSVDGLFVPLAVAAGVGLVLLWGMPLLRAGWEAAGSPRTRVAVMTILGITLSGIGVWGVFARTAFEFHLAVSPLSLAAGVLLLSAAARLQRRRQGYTRRESVAIAEWIMVFVLIGLSLFWVAYDYSAAVGTSRARDAEASLESYPDAVLFSAARLGLQGPGLREVACVDPAAAYPFRYDGLKLVLQSGDQYLFLPAGWHRSTGAAILIPRSDSLRLEFTPAVAREEPPGSRC